MPFLIIALLALSLAWALATIWNQRRATRRLHLAIQTQRLVLRDEKLDGLGRDWSQLSADVAELIAEITQLKQLRTDQLAQLQATLGSLQEAVLIVDTNNYIVLANRALEGIFPQAKNTLHQRLERALHSSAFLGYVESVRKNSATPQQEIEFIDGNRTIWVEVTGTLIPSFDQRDSWALFVIHDITKLKKLELVRKDFVANVSHELRTPLSVIKGYTETLVDGHLEMPVTDRDRFLRTIQRHTERLNSLLEDLLILSRLESINPGLRREPTDVTALVNEVVDDFRARPASAGHELTTHFEAGIPAVVIDPLKISQVLENLVDNALKYTPKGSRILVSLRLRNGEVEVSVSDNGLGIPQEDLPHIFERFYRVDKGRSREKGGTGLGLSIVKHIVQLHHGRAWAESKQGQGTTISFSLPLPAA